MDILDLLKHKLTDLPIEQNENETYIDLINRILSDFLNEINRCNRTSLKITDSEVDVTDYKVYIQKLCSGLIDTLNFYYHGNPSNAFTRLNKALTDAKIRSFLDKEIFINEGANFYRIRNFNGNYSFNKNQLFHIPFESRGKVKTQRYSIPGLPSLYISNSIYVAWEEMRRPNIDSIQAIRLCNTKQLTLLDLTTDAYTSKSTDIHGWDLLYKIIIWPLVACCSIKVRDHNDDFKPEYIIPQLLLQWINKEKLHGIKYSSTHIDLKNENFNGSFFNIVLPVRSFSDRGYCKELESLFVMTQVLSMQLRQFSTVSNRFYGQESIRTNVNLDIQSLELIKGVPQSYSETQFGILEHSLNFLKTDNLNSL
jgi:hypothetical protein